MSNESDAIIKHILNALSGIRKEAGFSTTVELVTESPISFDRAGKFPSLCVQTVRERITYYPAKRRKRVVRILITGFVRPGADTDKMATARGLAADVENALLADPTRGGAAVSTEVKETTIAATAHEEGARISCAVEIAAHEEI